MSAEFKISRFKYTWKNQWTAGIVYNPDDVVSVGGKVYACLVRHTSDADFYSDLNFVNTDTPPLAVPKWVLIADGVSWKGTWTTSTYYNIGDTVNIGGGTYVCLIAHTSASTVSGFETDYIDNSYWTVTSSLYNWRGNWSADTLYNLGDIARYNSTVYRCLDTHTSSVLEIQLVADIDKWEIVSRGIDWKEIWLTSTLYNINDVVRYGGNVYICIAQHTSASTINQGLDANLGSWQLLVNGVEYKGEWADNFKYKLNDVVKFGGITYKCTTPHYVPAVDPFNISNWEIFVPGQEYENSWNASVTYNPGDIVRSGGYLFVSTSVNLNSKPDFDQTATNTDWDLLFKGTRIQGTWSSTTSYLTGDIVRRGGQLYVAKSNVPAGQDTDVIDDGTTLNEPYWDLFIPSDRWRSGWQADVTYLIGDLISWRGAAYRAVLKHISSNGNRPDQDNEGTYWEQYTYGSPENVLSFIGDLKTFGIKEDGSTIGTTNISIGNSGQTLEVVNDAPAWTNFYSSADVYYVATNGVDGENRGMTQNSPWRTIRYALENITGPATVLVKTGDFEEILPLRVPAFVAVVGDELRGTRIKPVNGRYTQSDISALTNIYNYWNLLIPQVIQKIVVTTLYTDEDQILTGSAATLAEASLVQVLSSTVSSYTNSNDGATLIGTNTITVDVNELAAATQIENNKNFIIAQTLGWLTDSIPLYVQNISQLTVDLKKILDAFIHDLRYPGNYKTILAGQYFYNGRNYDTNKVQNMFLFNDGSGLRNCTLLGLEGELGALNTFLTQRPTAGAYASLDPGWGTADSTVFVGTRSPYIQNVTTFGTGCIGLKVDGSLHTGGNKTIVANDFTQILSDGIGVWCNGDGASEVVSVFTYYNHIGYLCTDGGKIRGTNGNCSYGTYGAVAEGFDLTETPITATVNNRYYGAEIGQVFTSGSSIIRLFYDHAGQNYTSATFSVAGSGINSSFISDEVRSRSISEIRLLDPGDSSAVGGSGYTLQINTAQSGDTNTITLAASDDRTPEEYRGLRIVLQTGTGAGQYGYIADYDDSLKLVYVAKEYYDTIDATETLSSGNEIILDTTDNLYVDDAVVFTGTTFGSINDLTIYYITAISGNNITVSLTQGGSDETLTDDTGTMILHKLGWESFRPGSVIEPVLDTTTSYFIEPRIVIDAPATTIAPRILPTSSTWNVIGYGDGKFVIMADGNGSGSSTAAYSLDGESWSSAPLPTTSTWSSVAYGDGKFIVVSTSGVGLSSTDAITWTTVSGLPVLDYTSIVYENQVWIAVASGTDQLARSTDGITWSTVSLPEGADWIDVAYGKGKFVAVAQSDSNTTNTAYSIDNGLTWSLGSFAGGCKSIAYGNDRFVAISGGYSGAEDAFISFDGINWISSKLPGDNWQSISYGQGLFVAVPSSVGDGYVMTTKDGVNWKRLDLGISADSYLASVFGSVGTDGKFYLLATGSNEILEIDTGAQALARINLSSNRINAIRLWETGSGYETPPTVTITDPNNSSNAVFTVRIADGVLSSPTILNGGEGYAINSTVATVTGDGFADRYQIGRELIVDGADRIPGPGDNLNIAGVDDYTYKILSATVLSGSLGDYRLKLEIAKNLGVDESPEHSTAVTIRQQYSQVRLTGHDFLDIGLGNFVQTNYPNTLFPVGTVLAPENEVKESNGGRVFYTTTDQDGNFRVGELFAVEQATGTVTISADFFQLEGLEEIALGGVSVGGSGVVIREFSTDPFFTADSNNVIPTQRAIKEYLARRISGGGSDAFTAQVTAGVVRVGPTLITTTTLETINIESKVKFNGPVNGAMLYHTFFLGGTGFVEED